MPEPLEEGVIGLGTTFEINDGAAAAFVPLATVFDIDPPDTKVEIVVSKRLAGRKKFPAEADMGELSFMYEWSESRHDRVEALKGKTHRFATKIPGAGPSGTTLTKTIEGFLTENKRQKIASGELQTVACKVTVTAEIS